MAVNPDFRDLFAALNNAPADGVGFAEAWQGREETLYGDQPVSVIGRSHLIVNKRASGRPQDLVDVGELERDDGER